MANGFLHVIFLHVMIVKCDGSRLGRKGDGFPGMQTFRHSPERQQKRAVFFSSTPILILYNPAHDPCVPVWITIRALWEGGAWPAHGERGDHDRRQAHKEPPRNRNSHLKEDGGWRTDR